jgi:hypothetical protein
LFKNLVKTSLNCCWISLKLVKILFFQLTLRLSNTPWFLRLCVECCYGGTPRRAERRPHITKPLYTTRLRTQSKKSTIFYIQFMIFSDLLWIMIILSNVEVHIDLNINASKYYFKITETIIYI